MSYLSRNSLESEMKAVGMHGTTIGLVSHPPTTITVAATRSFSPRPNMHRSILVIVLLAIFSCNLSAAERPHIVLVMADDQGWGDMAYNGHPVVKTPNFDEAAAAGLRFDKFYAAAPVCSPTRASVMTGRHPNRSGVFKWGYPLRPQETTLAESLKSAGYTTAHFGKWHLGSVRKTSPANPGEHGFDNWLSAPNFYDNDPVLSREGTAVHVKGESSIVAADAAIEWMKEKRKGDAPMLAVVWFGSPHSPHQAVEQDRKLYEDQPMNKQHFYGEITGMDRAFGKIRGAIGELGIRDNTILWYCSDNGALPKVGSTGGARGNKGKVYEGGLLVPSILEWPAKIQQARTNNVRCNTSDIYPTLLEFAGVKLDDQRPLDGVSLVGLIESKQASENAQREKPMGFWDFRAPGIGTPSKKWMGELLAAQQDGRDLPPHPSSQKAAELPAEPYSTESFPGHSAWIKGDWKLHRIESKNERTIQWELYNLKADPAESTNVVESNPQLKDSMQAELKQWLVSVVGSLNGDDY